MTNSIISITLFVIWTAIVYRWSIGSCGRIIKEQDKALKLLTNKLDTLLQTIDILNKHIQEGNK